MVVIVKAVVDVVHLGAVGMDGQWLLNRLVCLGGDVAAIEQLDCPSAHGIINVAADGENAITLFQGANVALGLDRIQAVLGGIPAQDWLVLQNETLHQRTAAALKVTRPGTADAIPDLVEVMAPND